MAAELTLPPFAITFTSMPGVEFDVIGGVVQLFASVSTPSGAVEFVLEGVPVEIRLPAGLVEPRDGVLDIGSFRPGNPDDLRVVYRSGAPTSIFVHVRVLVDQNFDCIIRPAVPVSFGACTFSGIPCQAVHDFLLIPSPNAVIPSLANSAPGNFDWIRHPVTPWMPNATGPYDGLFAARALHLNSQEAPFKSVSDWLGDNSEIEATAEFVLDDVVVPFFSPYAIPIPRHLTFGVRRQIIKPDDEAPTFLFSRAPVRIFFRRSPELAFILESLFYKSLPAGDLKTDLGLTFSAGVLFAGKPAGNNPAVNNPAPINEQAFVFDLGENYTIRLGYRRGFTTSGNGMPKPQDDKNAKIKPKEINALLHWEIASVVLDIMAIRLGYSLGQAISGHASFKQAGEITFDVFVSMPSKKGGNIELQNLDGQETSFVAEGIGWRQGGFHFEGIHIPDGMVVLIAKKFALIIQEIAVLAESGASYLSISGGIAWAPPSGFQAEVLLKRLRFRVAGDEHAPFMKLDGFFIAIVSSTVTIEAGGFFTDLVIPATATTSSKHIREFGLSGKVGLEIAGSPFLFGLDLLVGSVEGSPIVEYFLIQAYFQGSIPLAWFVLLGARVLFANNLIPLLGTVDKDSQQLRYYTWSIKNDPLNVPGERRLSTTGTNAAWKVQNHAWTLGIGAGVSIAALGKVVELRVFVLVIYSDDERGLLISGELFAGRSTVPLAFFALEWDIKNSRFSLLLGVNLHVSSFVSGAPGWLNNIASLTGTIYIGNDPATFAIGRLSDERTWLSLVFHINMWVTTYILFGFCMEYVDGPTGVKGVGLVVRIDGGINAGIVQVTYNAGFGFLIQAFSTGSADYSCVIWIEAGLHILLFGFLRFGISAGASFHNVGGHPSRGELTAEFQLDTPWFLPKVTWTFQISFGNLEPANLKTCVSPLRIAGAMEGLAQKDAKLFMLRTVAWDGTGQAPMFSINGISDPAKLSSTARAQLFKDALNADPTFKPIATDSTLAIDWSVAVNDQLGIGAAVAPNLGNQRSGDLTLTYDLIGISVQRRPRYPDGGDWVPLETRAELPSSFLSSGGVALTGVVSPEHLTSFWDPGVRISGQTGTKRLLLNASTPFTYQTSNSEADEQLLRDHPSWPCCREEERNPLVIHEVNFKAEIPGTEIDKPRRFTQSQSLLRFRQPPLAVPRAFSYTTGLVAVVETPQPGPILRADLDEDAAYVFLTLGFRRAINANLRIVLFDASGGPAGEKSIPMSADQALQSIYVPALGPVRRIEVQITQLVAQNVLGPVVPGATPVVASAAIAARPATSPLGLQVKGSSSVPANVAAAAPLTVSFSSGMTITVGTTESTTLIISGPAPAGGLTVPLSSSNTGVVTVPASATFAPGDNQVFVPVRAVAVGRTQINASLNNSSAVAVIEVLPVWSLSVADTTVGLGLSANLQVTSSVAAQNPTTVHLTSSDPSIVTVTPSVSIAAGATVPVSPPQVTGVELGSATITALVIGLASGTGKVSVTEALHFSAGSIDSNYHVEIWSVSYVGVGPYLDSVRQQLRCRGGHSHAGYEGKGKLFFLPNHDYEIGFTTGMTIAHPSSGASPGAVTEYIYFQTKGLPGLNLVQRTGEEIEPYVSSAYTGGKGLLYREEPITLAFKEDFSISLPLTSRPTNTAPEQTTLLTMQLLAQPETAPTLSTPVTTTSTDWIVKHRTLLDSNPPAPGPWQGIVSASTLVPSNTISSDPFRARLAALTELGQQGTFVGGQPEPCFIADPRKVVSPILVAPPQGVPDPVNPGKELWTAARHTAIVRLMDSPYVDGSSFVPVDLTAFQFALDTGVGGGSDWAAVDGALKVSDPLNASARRFAVFGAADWNYVVIRTSIGPDAVRAGIGVALPAGDTPDRGLFAVIEGTAANRNLNIYRRVSGSNFDPAVLTVQAKLPDPTDPAAPITLTVTAFDDVLRAEVGDIKIEVPRNELREGRLCLVAEGAAQFNSLRVTGLDMYSFPVSISSFRSFGEHIQSYTGPLDAIGPGSLGPGTTTTTTAALWASTASRIGDAMRPDHPPAERQALFDQWVAQLGLALKDDVTTLQISCFVNGGVIEFFLLESPEPLDFTEEVKIALSRRDVIKIGLSSQSPAVSIAAATGASPALTASQQVLNQLLAVQNITSIPQSAQPAVAARKPILHDVVHMGDSLMVELDPKSLGANATTQGKMSFVEVLEGGSEPRLRFFTGTVESKGVGLRATVQAHATDDLSVTSPSASLLTSPQLTTFPTGTIVALSLDQYTPIDWRFPITVYTPVDVSVLQDAAGKHALVIPLANGVLLPLPSLGAFRMKFDIARDRWKFTDPPDSLNRYAATSTLTLMAASLPASVDNTSVPNRLRIPQLVDGNNWKTTLVLVNTDSVPAQVNMTFHNADGTLLGLPLDGVGAVTQYSDVIPVGGSRTIETQGQADALAQGWAEIVATKSVAGAAIFRLHMGTGVDSEGAVTLSPGGTKHFLLPFDNTQGFVTTMAILNPNPVQNASVSIVFRDETGQLISNEPLILDANNRQALILPSKFGKTASMRGVAEFTSTVEIAALGLRVNPGGAFTSIEPIAIESLPAPGSGLAIPQVVDGGGWQTTIILVNAGPAAAPFTIKFLGPDGTQFKVPLAGGAAVSEFADVIPVGGSRTIQTNGLATGLSQGWGQVVSSGSIAGTAIFRQRLTATRDSEAAVPLSVGRMSRFILPFDNTQGFLTAMALANQNPSAATVVSVILRGQNNEILGNESINLGPLAQTAFTLPAQFQETKNARGIAEFTTDGVNLSALGLRFSPGGSFVFVHPIEK